MQTYHQKAQAFIKSSRKKGYNVTAEDGELIAHPPGTPGYVKPFVPTYGGKAGGKMSNGAGWGGEKYQKMRKKVFGL